jgi:uncharacterized protein
LYIPTNERINSGRPAGRGKLKNDAVKRGIKQKRKVMYYILFYKTVDNYVERRASFREKHLAYANAAHERGELIIAGALADPADSAVLVFQGEGAHVAEEFAKNDPYVINGLITEWEVRPWSVVIGEL